MPGAVATINYLDVDAQPQRVDDATLPWSHTITTTDPSVFANGTPPPGHPPPRPHRNLPIFAPVTGAPTAAGGPPRAQPADKHSKGYMRPDRQHPRQSVDTGGPACPGVAATANTTATAACPLQASTECGCPSELVYSIGILSNRSSNDSGQVTQTTRDQHPRRQRLRPILSSGLHSGVDGNDTFKNRSCSMAVPMREVRVQSPNAERQTVSSTVAPSSWASLLTHGRRRGALRTRSPKSTTHSHTNSYRCRSLSGRRCTGPGWGCPRPS